MRVRGKMVRVRGEISRVRGKMVTVMGEERGYRQERKSWWKE